MYGDERKRFCSDCKLNVYNLSGMTRREAENLVLNAEGRLCVRYFKRADGTVLTADCPVGWAAVKRRVSRVATATASIVFGIASGLMGIRAAEAFLSLFPVPLVEVQGDMIVESEETFPAVGIPVFTDVNGEVYLGDVDIEALRKRKTSVGSGPGPQRR
jgi:hypothetical protein